MNIKAVFIMHSFMHFTLRLHVPSLHLRSDSIVNYFDHVTHHNRSYFMSARFILKYQAKQLAKYKENIKKKQFNL